MPLQCAVFFLFLYYIRPQDWIGGIAGFNIMRPMIVIWAGALFSSRSRSPWPGIVRTPHDWCMLLYFGWVLWTGAGEQSAFSGFFPLVVFYAFTVHSLVTWESIMGFLKAWNFMLLGVTGIALASLIKLDFTGAVDLTIRNEGRLCIGTWLHNNPNALGHSLAVVMPLSYLLHFWRGNALGRLVIFPAQSTLALWCIYETQSKGAFLVSGALMVLLFVIGRPLVVKAFALAVALTLGISALSFLPRMSQVGNLRADEGVQGRLMAWELAKTAMEQHPAGWKQFLAYINWRQGNTIIVEPKATHSSYVQVGADLGKGGMALYILALWAAYRTTLHAVRACRDDDARERTRRALMMLILAYAVSGWMINREYHTEYFLLIAVAAAMHRLSLAEERGGKLLMESNSPVEPHESPNFLYPPASNWLPAHAPLSLSRPHVGVVTSFPGTTGLSWSTKSKIAPVEDATEINDSTQLAGEPPFWNRVGIWDAAATGLLTWVVTYIWEYILKNL